MAQLKYKRVLLKLSGEALAGEKGTGFDFTILERLATEVSDIVKMGAAVGLVIGGGNIVRGAQLSKMGMDRVGADYMGMLGTIINALALQDVLEKAQLETRVMTAIAMESIAEPFIRRRAMHHLDHGRVVIDPLQRVAVQRPSSATGCLLGGVPDLDLARFAKRGRRLLAQPAILPVDRDPTRSAAVDPRMRGLRQRP